MKVIQESGYPVEVWAEFCRWMAGNLGFPPESWSEVREEIEADCATIVAFWRDRGYGAIRRERREALERAAILLRCVPGDRLSPGMAIERAEILASLAASESRSRRVFSGFGDQFGDLGGVSASE